MNKDYLFIEPNNFIRLGEIDIDGHFNYEKCNDFNVENPKENFLIFEIGYAEYNEGKQYDCFCKEIVSGEKFKFEISDKITSKSGKRVPIITLSSEKLGLYSNALVLKEVVNEPSKVSGLLCHFNENSDEKVQYCRCLKNMFEEAKAYKVNYDRLINGPDRYLRKQMKYTYKKSK